MLKLALYKGANVKIYGSCADASGLKQVELIEGTQLHSMAELTNWVVDSDNVFALLK